jgi:hypothetical protein
MNQWFDQLTQMAGRAIANDSIKHTTTHSMSTAGIGHRTRTLAS